MLSRRASALALLLGSVGCARGAPSDAPPAPSAAPATAGEGEGAAAAGDAAPGDAGRRALGDAEPGVDVSARLDASAPDPACSAPELDLAVAVVDPRCAIGPGEARSLRAALEKRAPLPLKQEASATADGLVLVRVVNTGDKPLALPLSFHPSLPAFTALAEGPDRAIYELEPPRLEVGGARGDGDGDGGDAGDGPRAKARFARVVLAPGKAAIARVRVAPTVLRRVAPACADGGACAPPCPGASPCAPRLAPGTYVLHVGELVVDVEAGAPARVPWTVR